MANPEITDLELQREVEALRTRRRQSVNRAVLDPDLPDLQVPGVFSESRPSLDSQASASSTASSSYPVPSTPPDTGLGAFAFDEHHFNVNPPLFGSSHRARYLARRNARAAQTADAQEKGPLPEPPTAEEAASYGAPGSGAPLLWVPAGAHPEISPADFRRFMKEQAERNVSQHETDSNIPTPRASLSPALDGASDEQGEAVVAANRLLRRNSSVARRSSSLRKQIRPDARDVSSTEAPAGPMAERARRPGSLLAVHSQLPVARDVGEADATPSAPDTREDDRGAGAATHAADNDMGHPRPLPTPGASQLQRNSRNMKLELLSTPQATNLLLKRGDLVIIDGDRGRDLVLVVEPSVDLNLALFINFLKKKIHFDSLITSESQHYRNDEFIQMLIDSKSGQKKKLNPKLYDVVELTELIIPSKQVLRFATPWEVTTNLHNKFEDELKALHIAQSKLQALNDNSKSQNTNDSSSNNFTNAATYSKPKLNIKILNAEFQFDRKKLTFYYVCEERNDFRDLIKELFKYYKTRIWLCAIPNNLSIDSKYYDKQQKELKLYQNIVKNYNAEDLMNVNDFSQNRGNNRVNFAPPLNEIELDNFQIAVYEELVHELFH